MATKYLVASGTGTIAWNTTANWRDGSPTGSVATVLPSATDDAIIYRATAGAVSVTLSGTAATCNNISVTGGGAVTTLAFTGTSAALTVNGSMDLSNATSTVTWAASGALTFTNPSAGGSFTINTKAGSTMSCPIVFTGPTDTTSWTLASALTSTSTITLNRGVINLSTFTLSGSTFTTSGTSVRGITFGTGASMSLSGSASVWNATGSNFTLTGTANVTLTSASSTARTMTLNTSTNYPLFNFNTAASGALTFTGAGTCSVKSTTVSPSTVTITSGATCIVDSSGLTTGAGALTMSGGTLDITGGVINLGSLTCSTGTTNTIKFPATGGPNMVLTTVTPWTTEGSTLTLTGSPLVNLTYVSSTARSLTVAANTSPIFDFNGGNSALTITGSGSCYLQGTVGTGAITVSIPSTISSSFTTTSTSITFNANSTITGTLSATSAIITINGSIFDISSLSVQTFAGIVTTGTSTIKFNPSIVAPNPSLILNGAVPWNTAGSLTITGNQLINLTFPSGTTIRTITLTSTTNPTFNFSGIATGALTINGAGTCNLQGSTNTTSITISSGVTCKITSRDFTVDSAAISVASGGTLDVSSGILNAKTFSGNACTINFPATTSYNLNLSGSGSIWSLTGASTFLSGGETYTNTALVNSTFSSSTAITVDNTPVNTSYYPILAFSSTGGVTINSGIVRIDDVLSDLTINGTRVYVGGSFSSTGILTLNTGILDLETFSVQPTIKSFVVSPATGTRTVLFGLSSYINITGTGTAYSNSDILIFGGAGNPTFYFSGASATTINFGNPTGNKATIIMEGIATGAYTMSGGPFNLDCLDTTSTFKDLVLNTTDVSIAPTSTVYCTGALTLNSGYLRLTGDISCNNFISNGLGTREVVRTGYNGSIYLTGSGAQYAVSGTGLTIPDGLKLVSQYTGNGATSITTSASGSIGKPTITLEQSGLSTFSITGSCYLDVYTDINALNIVSGTITLVNALYCTTTITFTAGTINMGIYDINTDKFLLSSASNKVIDFGGVDGRGLYLSYSNLGGTVWNASSTNGASLTLTNLPYIIIWNTERVSTTITNTALATGSQLPYVAARSDTGPGFPLTISGNFNGLDFSQYAGTLSITGTVSNTGDLLGGPSTVFPTSTTTLITNTPTGNNIFGAYPVYRFSNTVNMPISVSATCPVNLGDIINSTKDVSISSTNTVINTNTVKSTGALTISNGTVGSVLNTSVTPNVSIPATPTIYFGTTLNIQPLSSSSNPGAFTINPLNSTGTISCGFKNADLFISSSGFSTYIVSDYLNNISSAAGCSPTIIGSSYVTVLGNVSVYDFVSMYMAPEAGKTVTLSVSKTTGTTGDAVFNGQGTVKLLSDLILGTTSIFRVINLFTGSTLDLNSYTLQVAVMDDSYMGAGGTINLNNGAINIVRSNNNGVATPYNITSNKIYGPGSINFTANDIYAVTISDNTTNNYSNIDFKFSSTNTSQSYYLNLGTKTINNLRNTNSVRKTILFNQSNYLNVNNFDLSYMDINGNNSGESSPRVTINYTGTSTVNLNDSRIKNTIVTPANKFYAITVENGGTNTDQGNNSGWNFGTIIAAINSAFFLLF